jgi:DedD protein
VTEPADETPPEPPAQEAAAAPAEDLGHGAPTAGEDTPGSGPVPPDGAGAETPEPQVGLKAWAVQLGSFAEHGNAIALRDRLRDAGFTAFVETVSVHDRPMTRVFVGPELLRGNARETLERLQRTLELEGQVVRYPRG